MKKTKENRFLVNGYQFGRLSEAEKCAKRLKAKIIDRFCKKEIADFSKFAIAAMTLLLTALSYQTTKASEPETAIYNGQPPVIQMTVFKVNFGKRGK